MTGIWGPRVQTVGFSYSDIIANQMAVLFNGGDCAEDINEHLRGPLGHIKGLSVCSDDQADLFSGQAYTWRAILTNDHKNSPKQIVAFYNKRGDSERIFDVMNNDFSWSRLPCSLLCENTAFMILTAIIANFYRYIIEEYSRRIAWLKDTFRLKKFIFRFISVPAKWIRSGRREILKLYTDKDYSPLLE